MSDKPVPVEIEAAREALRQLGLLEYTDTETLDAIIVTVLGAVHGALPREPIRKRVPASMWNHQTKTWVEIPGGVVKELRDGWMTA